MAKPRFKIEPADAENLARLRSSLPPEDKKNLEKLPPNGQALAAHIFGRQGTEEILEINWKNYGYKNWRDFVRGAGEAFGGYNRDEGGHLRFPFGHVPASVSYAGPYRPDVPSSAGRFNDAASPRPEIPDVKGRLMDKLAQYESGSNYNAMWGNKERPELTGMSVREFMAYQVRYAAQYGSGSAGFPQIMGATLIDMAGKHGIDLGQKFDKPLQRELFGYLLDRRGYPDWIAGKITTGRFMDNLANEWAALPNSQGTSSLANGLNPVKPGVSAREFAAFLDDLRDNLRPASVPTVTVASATPVPG